MSSSGIRVASVWQGVHSGRLGGINTIVQKYGRNSAVPNGTWEGVLQAAAQFYYPTVATTVRIKAGGNAADDAAGAGARSVTIQGLNELGETASETVATAGASASSATTTTFMRVFRAFVDTVGAVGVANTAAIMIEDGAGSNDMITIVAAEGQTQYCSYSIPLGQTGYLLSADVAVDAAKAADFILYTRANLLDVTVPVSPRRLRYYWDGVLGPAALNPNAPYIELPALTDIWIEARGGGAATEVTGNMEILLTEDVTA